MHNTQPSAKKTLFIVVLLIILAAFALVFSEVSKRLSVYELAGGDPSINEGVDPNATAPCSPRSNDLQLSQAATDFMDDLQAELLKRTGFRPIEGYEPSMYLTGYSALLPEDFHCVEAIQGYYKNEYGVVSFVPTVEENMMHTAARAITAVGHGTLLENVARRLGVPVDTDADIKAVLEVILAEPMRPANA